MTEIDRLFEHYPKDLLDDFKEYHAKNPHVYKMFCEFTWRIKATGRTKYSSKMIINAIRWETDLSTTGDVFKINDKFQSIYGRLFVYHNPEFLDFFEFRIRENYNAPSFEEKKRKELIHV